ncbi:hypothetical protein ABFS82_14G091900 [Erythranthe guttata]
MERSEPTLVPEWLRNPGSLNGGGSASHSDGKNASKLVRNKSFVNSNGNDFGRSLSSDRTTSSYFRRSSSNNGSGNSRSHTSFGRKQHDTYDSREKDKSVLGNRRNFSDSFGNNTLSSKFEREGLRHSQSIDSAKHADTWHRKVTTNSGRNNTDGLLTKNSPIGEVNKKTFKRDFPSLGTEDRTVIPSPGLSSPIQSLPSCTSSLINGEKWTSALAEVPVSVGSHGNGILSVQELAPLSSASMAEAVVQGPSRVQTAPQLSMGTQRLEELAIKKSKQLIPVTPSTPKTLVLNSTDKHKTKASQHNHPISSSLPVNQSPRGGPTKADFSKASTTVGKLHVLKPMREINGVVKDNSSASGSSKLTSSSTPAAPTRGPPNNHLVPDHKPVITVLEKRPTSQAQSRNDFFNTVRKKSMAIPSPSSSSEKLSDLVAAVEPAPNTPPRAGGSGGDDESLGVGSCGDHLSETRGDLVISKNVRNGEKHPSTTDPVFSEEEEATFLRSMGWEENADEGGLTEEEISAFFRDVAKQYISSKPCLKILMPFGSHISSIRGISSGPSSSDAKLES